VLLASAWWRNRAGEAPKQVEVARQAGTDVKMTSQVVRSLERKGLLVREPDPVDTRAKRLRVTDRGAKLAAQAIGAVEAADAEFFGDVEEADVLAMLERLSARAGSAAR
jgi:DNA-binding MarR family transcriptional regulator